MEKESERKRERAEIISSIKGRIATEGLSKLMSPMPLMRAFSSGAEAYAIPPSPLT